MTWTPEKIKALRKRLGLNQSAMAERLGYTRQQTVSDLEKGNHPPGPQVEIILGYLLAEADAADAQEGDPA